jgi:hypothetical protein
LGVGGDKGVRERGESEILARLPRAGQRESEGEGRSESGQARAWFLVGFAKREGKKKEEKRKK